MGDVMKTIPVAQDTRSEQKFTKEKLSTMRPGDIAAVATQRGYDVNPVTGRLSHDSFLKQQEDNDFYEGREDHTESGSVPDDYPVEVAKGFHAAVGEVPSVQGGKGGLHPAEPLASGTDEQINDALGEQSSAEDHTGKQSAHATLGSVQVAQTPVADASEPLINVPVEGKKS
jgi:hypothetical protein